MLLLPWPLRTGARPSWGADGTSAAVAVSGRDRGGRAVTGRCYRPAAMARTVGSTNSRKFRRRPPSEAEQLRRTTLIREMARRVQASTDQWKREQGVS